MKSLAAFAAFWMCCVSIAGAGRPAPAAASNTIKLLWRDPGPIALRDLYWGAGSADRAPKPPFTFVQENTSGTKPKIDVTDAGGVAWSVKLAPIDPAGNEVHAEIATTRLVWALGYFVDENYFVPAGRIEGVKDLKRAAELIGADGGFRVARFERRPANVQSRGQWHIEKNPFVGTRELSGLQVLMMWLGSWDVPPHNTGILRVPMSSGDAEERYVLTDLGSTFGRMKGGIQASPSRWNLTDFTEARFVAGVIQGRLTFRDTLLGNKPWSVPVADARWFVTQASQLSDRQLRRALEAAGASPQEVAGFSTQLAIRLAELKAAIEK